MKKGFVIGMSVLAATALTTVSITPAFAIGSGGKAVEGRAVEDFRSRMQEVNEKARLSELELAKGKSEAQLQDAVVTELARISDGKADKAAMKTALKSSFDVKNSDGSTASFSVKDIAVKIAATDEFLRKTDLNKLTEEDKKFVDAVKEMNKISAEFLTLFAKSGDAQRGLSPELSNSLEVMKLQSLVITKIATSVGTADIQSHIDVMRKILTSARDPHKTGAQATLETLTELAKNSKQDVRSYSEELIRKLLECLKLLGLVKK